jgi:pyruvate dehydrogenase E1 component alpha subunit
MPSARVDGNDVWAVAEAAETAVRRARDREGPTLLECQTYRHYGHSKSDPGAYRSKEEVERWLARDPIDVARARLLERGASPEEVDAAEQEARGRIDRAVEAALAAPYPDPERERATEFKA